MSALLTGEINMRDELKFTQPITVTRPKLPNFHLYLTYLEKIWSKKWLTNNGPIHEEFKEELKQYLTVNQVELFTNGHLALEIALKSLELKGEVITTPFTFASTIHAISNCGLKPVFCDIELDTFNIDADQIESHINENTSAILAVHVFGNPCNLQKIARIAEKYKLKVIYDAAHAFGVEVDGVSISRFGDLSMFSFHATKVFHSIEGGMLAFNDSELIPKLKALKNFGITSEETVDYIGTNAKMNEFQAAMGLCNLQTIDEEIHQRKLIYEEYADQLTEVKSIRFLPEMEHVKHNYAYFPVLLNDSSTRDRLFEKLKEYNVFARKYFYPLCNDFECYDYNSNNTPNAQEVSDRILSLPMYTELELPEVKQICEIIRYELRD